VSSALLELITKLVPAVMLAVGADKTPCVPPGVFALRKMIEFAVTAVVDTVIVPDVIAAETPMASDAAVEAWIRSLLPVWARLRFPFVAVILPNVAVKVVEAVKDPVTAVFPVALPILVAPVPPVPIVVTAAPEVLIVVVPVIAAPPAETVSPPVVAVSPVDAVREPVTAVLPVALPMCVAPVPPVPIVVTAAPEVLMPVVPVIEAPPADTISSPEVVRVPVSAVLPVAFPMFTAPVPPVPIVVVAAPEALINVVPTCVRPARVVAPVTPSVPLNEPFPAVKSPVNAVAPVTDKVPSTVAFVPTSRVVVDMMLPGATKALGIERVIVPGALDPVEVISLVVPAMMMLPAVGVTVVDPSDRVFRAPLSVPSRVQFAESTPCETE
jgi:hypothetical protein